MPPLSLKLLGPFSASLAGQPVDAFRSIKNQALLIHLVVERAYAHRRESLFTLLWPGMPERSARHNLRQALYALGQIFPDISANEDDPPLPLLLVNNQTVQLNPQACVKSDIHLLDQLLARTQNHSHPDLVKCPACTNALEQAALLYRGDFLADFYLEDSGEFENWAAAHRAAYQNKIFETLQTLTDIAVERQEYHRASVYIERQLAMDNLKESTHRQKMNVLALSGRRVEALRHYRRYAQLLEDELSVTPSGELQALYQRIQTHNLHESAPPEAKTGPPIVPRHNLPSQLTPFVGRLEELARLDEMLASPHTCLITILGPGGMGKTRLALAAGEAQLETKLEAEPIARFPDGVYFVELASLNEADQIAPAIAAALKIPLLEGERTPQQQVLRYLQRRQLLLILDNFEHLKDGAGMLTEILGAAPGVKLLVTSRERLHLHVEQLYPIQGLEYPDRESPRDAGEYPAAQLFLQAACRNAPEFVVRDGDDQTHLARICRLLSGMPLAIELAAAWVDTLSLSEILTEIQNGLDFLEAQALDIPERHRSMRATIEASWRRLDEDGQGVFAQLAIFRGGFTRQAAEEIAGASLRSLSRLVTKSFLQYDREQQRYQIHELLRRYGAEVLAEDQGQEIAVRDRHCAFYCRRLSEKERELWIPQPSFVWAGLQADFGNIEDAWRWGVQRRLFQKLQQALLVFILYYMFNNRLDQGIRMCHWTIAELIPGSLSHVEGNDSAWIVARILAIQGWYYFLTGKHSHAEDWFTQSEMLFQKLALAGLDTRLDQAFLYTCKGWFYFHNNFECGVEYGEKARLLARASGDRLWEAHYTRTVGAYFYIGLCKYELAERRLNQAIDLYHTLDADFFVAMTLIDLAWLARTKMDYARSETLFKESIALGESQNARQVMANALLGLGYLKLFLGQFGQAADYLEQSLVLLRESTDLGGVVEILHNLGRAYAFLGQFTRAMDCEGESRALAEEFLSSYPFGFFQAGMLDIWLGQYDAARVTANRIFAFLENEDANLPRLVHQLAPFAISGWIALAQGEFEIAREHLQKQIDYRHLVVDPHTREWAAIDQATLSLAEWRLGENTIARRQIFEALGTAVEMRAFISLLHVLPILPLMLAAEEDEQMKARSIEINALAYSHPFLANNQFFHDIAGRHMQAVEAALPPVMVAAAKARGKALDFWPAAEALLDELRQMGWEEEVE